MNLLDQNEMIEKNVFSWFMTQYEFVLAYTEVGPMFIIIPIKT